MISSFVYKPFDLSRLSRFVKSAPGHKDYRVYMRDGSSRDLISPWHHIPLDVRYQTGAVILPFVCEIPRKCTAKMEVTLREKFNPISQDMKDGQPRYMPIEPKFNYGMLPMTYEDPGSNCPISGVVGDGDPLDVVDISIRNSDSIMTGTVVPVRLLGSFCFIDNGEADWKLIVTRDDSARINTHTLDEMFAFFENYKPGSGSYIFEDRRVFDISDTLELINHARNSYENLINETQFVQSDASPDIWIPGTPRV